MNHGKRGLSDYSRNRNQAGIRNAQKYGMQVLIVKGPHDLGAFLWTMERGVKKFDKRLDAEI